MKNREEIEERCDKAQRMLKESINNGNMTDQVELMGYIQALEFVLQIKTDACRLL